METVMTVLKIAGISIPIFAAGGAVFATIKWKIPSLVKRVDAIEEHDYIKKSELYHESGETKYQPVGRCDQNMVDCQNMLTKELQRIGTSISNLHEGHEALREGFAAIDKRTALMDQRLKDFIKYHAKD